MAPAPVLDCHVRRLPPTETADAGRVLDRREPRPQEEVGPEAFEVHRCREATLGIESTFAGAKDTR